MDDPEDVDLSRMTDGSLDVNAELDFISRFREMGMDTEGMEDILFNDIEEYKRRKRELIHRELTGTADYNEPIIHEEMKLDIPEENLPMDEGDIDIPDEGDLQDEDLLLLGSPFIDQDNEDELDSLDLSEGDHAINEPLVNVEPDAADPENVERIPEETQEPDETNEDEKVMEKEERTGRERIEGGRFKGDRRILIGVVSVTIIALVLGSYILFNLIDDNGVDGNGFDPVIDISDINPRAGDLVQLQGSPRDDGFRYRWEIRP